MLTAVGSFLQARHQTGNWLVRMEDLDPPREMPGAADNILHTLEGFGLHWDEEVIYQSQRETYYQDALNQLQQHNLLYPCRCSRKKIQEFGAVVGKIGLIYPGTCRQASHHPWEQSAIRIKVNNHNTQFYDLIQGNISQQLAIDTGDINLKRADGIFAYHLAVVVDDHLQNITEIVRGYDLLQCTPIQIFLQQQLNYKIPDYIHLPIIVNQNNEKLSKQTGASSIENDQPEKVLIQILNLLNQNPPTELAYANKDEILDWGIKHWDINACTGQKLKI
jgi:glutamyl-Q tRNA(Asp) synthetase